MPKPKRETCVVITVPLANIEDALKKAIQAMRMNRPWMERGYPFNTIDPGVFDLQVYWGEPYVADVTTKGLDRKPPKNKRVTSDGAGSRAAPRHRR